jgi:ABC-type transport system substrate-binding protein
VGVAIWPVSWRNDWHDNPHAAAEKLTSDPRFTFIGPDYPTDGPYQVVSHVRGKRTVLRPMPYYDDMTCGGYIKQIVDKAYPSRQAKIAAAASHDADVTMFYLPDSLPDLRRHAGSYRLHVDPSFTVETVMFNVDATYHGKPNPFSDAHVRQALALAVDRIGFIQQAVPVGSQTARSIVAWTPLVNTPTLVQPFADRSLRGQWDPIARQFTSATGRGRALQDAKTLLVQTPWRHGFTFDFYTMSESATRVAEEAILSRIWAKLGVRAHQYHVPFQQLLGSWQQGGIVPHGAFQASAFATIGGPDPDGWRTTMESRYIDRRAKVHTGANGNVSGIRDPLLDRIMEAAARTLDSQVRSRNYVTMQRRVNQQAYWIPLYYRPYISTSDNRVLNFQASPFEAGGTLNMYAWKVGGR